MSTYRVQTLKGAQNRLCQLRDEVAELGYAPLGPEYKRQKAPYLQNAIAAHRFLTKFEVPKQAAAEKRREASINKFFDTDASNIPTFDYRDLDRDGRRTFLGAREWLRQCLKGFRPTYRFAFPSGESTVSTQGDTDMFDKLVREDQWTCSVDALPYAAMIAYNNLAIKRVVRSRFYHKWKKQARSWLQQWFDEAVVKGHKPGFYCFMRMFSSLMEIAPMRVTTVPKNNTTDRVITCEATWSMVAQLSLALDLREHLKRATGIDISYWQNVHRALIRNGRLATIDFSDASNRNRWCVVKELFPPRVVKYLSILRSTTVEHDGVYHPVIMFAPMGAGFTFDVMTLTLLAYARQFDTAATVFGDDVIIKAEVAQNYVSFVETLGWRVNQNKSFIDGNFRESCGAFAALDEDKLLVSYDIHYPQTIPDLYITLNKLVRVRDACTGDLRLVLARCLQEIYALLPAYAVTESRYRSTALLDYIVEDHDRFIESTEQCEERVESDYVENQPHKGRTNVVRLVMSYVQRNVVVASRYVSTPDSKPDVNLAHESAKYACFLRRGASYGLSARSTTRAVKVDAWTGTSLNRVPLLTVL